MPIFNVWDSTRTKRKTKRKTILIHSLAEFTDKGTIFFDGSSKNLEVCQTLYIQQNYRFSPEVGDSTPLLFVELYTKGSLKWFDWTFEQIPLCPQGSTPRGNR
jgi:hypothetical protein